MSFPESWGSSDAKSDEHIMNEAEVYFLEMLYLRCWAALLPLGSGREPGGCETESRKVEAWSQGMQTRRGD